MSIRPARPGTPEKLWYAQCPDPTPLGLASQLGWLRQAFQDPDTEIHALAESPDPDFRASYYDHHVHNSFRQGGNVAALWARSLGRETRVIGINWIEETQLIVTLADAGIHQIKDLRSRRLALPRHPDPVDHRRAGALRGFTVALEYAGLTYKDVEFIDLPMAPKSELPPAPGQRAFRVSPPFDGGYSAEIYALIRREVDAIYVKGAHGAHLARQLQTRVLMDLRDHPDPLARTNNAAPRPVTVDQQLLDSRPDLVVRFLAQVVAIGPWAREHPAEAIAYIARESRTTEEWVRYAYGHDVYRRLHTDLDEVAIAGLDAYKRFLLQWGFLKQDFDTWSWIDPAPLEEVQRLAGKVAAA